MDNKHHDLLGMYSNLLLMLDYTDARGDQSPLLANWCVLIFLYVIFTFCSPFCDKYSILTPANVRMVNIERRKLLSNQDARSQVFFVLFVFWNSFLHIILLYSLKPNAYITCFASGIIFSWEVNEWEPSLLPSII